jgi:hypothetical protein
MKNFKFTFKTDAEYFKARLTGFIPKYDCIRVTVERLGGGKIDFPIHSEEEFHETMKRHKHNILDIYQSTGFWEWDED